MTSIHKRAAALLRKMQFAGSSASAPAKRAAQLIQEAQQNIKQAVKAADAASSCIWYAEEAYVEAYYELNPNAPSTQGKERYMEANAACLKAERELENVLRVLSQIKPLA